MDWAGYALEQREMVDTLFCGLKGGMIIVWSPLMRFLSTIIINCLFLPLCCSAFFLCRNDVLCSVSDVLLFKIFGVPQGGLPDL